LARRSLAEVGDIRAIVLDAVLSLIKNQIFYAILISEPQRDVAFIAKVKRGLRVR